jgi:hypothetical protein
VNDEWHVTVVCSFRCGVSVFMSGVRLFKAVVVVVVVAQGRHLYCSAYVADLAAAFR